MTRVYTINGKDRTVKPFEIRKSVREAYTELNLADAGVDHALIYKDPFTGAKVAIVVYEFSLFVPPDKQVYFSILGKLYGGNAVIYAEDRNGTLVTVPEPPPVMFYRSKVEVEAAIQRGELERPKTTINGELVWSWPNNKGDSLDV